MELDQIKSEAQKVVDDLNALTLPSGTPPTVTSVVVNFSDGTSVTLNA